MNQETRQKEVEQGKKRGHGESEEETEEAKKEETSYREAETQKNTSLSHIQRFLRRTYTRIFCIFNQNFLEHLKTKRLKALQTTKKDKKHEE